MHRNQDLQSRSNAPRREARLPPTPSTRRSRSSPLRKGGVQRKPRRRSSHDADASSEPGCSRDQKQPYPDGDGPGGSGDALTGRCETLDSYGCRHDSHRAKVHDADDQADRHQTETAVAAVEAEAQAVSPGGAGVGRQRTAAPGVPPGSRRGDAPFHAVSWREPVIRTTTPTAMGTARASAGCCIWIVASATPSGKAAIPNTVHTKKYPAPASAVSRPSRVSPVLPTARR